MGNWMEFTSDTPKPNRKCPDCGKETVLTVTQERICRDLRECGWKALAPDEAIETTIVPEIDHKMQAAGEENCEVIE